MECAFRSYFEQLKILKLKQTNIFQTSCFVYKSLDNLIPSPFRTFFIINNEIHHYNKRTAYKIHQIQFSLNLRPRSIRVYGVKMWNSLSNAVTQSPSFSIFKNQCKKAYSWTSVLTIFLLSLSLSLSLPLSLSLSSLSLFFFVFFLSLLPHLLTTALNFTNFLSSLSLLVKKFIH